MRGRDLPKAPAPGGCWPTDDQVLLLRAALLEREPAAAAWARWRAANELDDADGGSSRLFPLAYRNLPPDAVAEQDLGRLKGAYRAAWFRNQLLFKRAAEVLAALGEAGIPTVALKGLALALAHYGDAGVRPMDDIDVLVPPDEFERALGVLGELGWTPEPDLRPEVGERSIHGLHLAGRDGRNLDLHRYALERLSTDGPFWDASVGLEVMGVPTRTLCPTDQLLHVLAHGGRWQPVTPLRWLADAVVIERTAGGGIDWERLVAEAARRRVTARLAAALEHLVAALGFPVPGDVVAALRRAPKSVLERWAQHASTRPVGGGNWLPIVLDDYVRRSQLDPSLRFGSFVTEFFGTRSPARLAGRIARKAVAVTAAQAMLGVAPRLVPRCAVCGCVVLTVRPGASGLCDHCEATAAARRRRA